MDKVIEHIFTNFEQYLIVGLLVVLFFKESLMSYINAKLGREEDAPEWGKKATSEINRLAEYANHDTTEKLNVLHDMGKGHEKVMTEVRDTLRDLTRTMQEIKEYGIKCREK